MLIEEGVNPKELTPHATEYLEISDLTVSFGEFVAVRNLSVTAMQGEVRFLIGPNGAGKTTLIDAITGLVPSTGAINKSGVPLNGKPVHKIARLGVGRTFQTASVFEDLTVEQNLDVAAGAGRSAWQLLRQRKKYSDAVQEALDIAGLSEIRHRSAGILSHGQKQWLEIGMLLVQNAEALLLDEPVAGMSADERDQTGELLKKIARTRIVLVVEHDMDFMRAFADQVTVMAAGQVLSSGTVAEIQADPRVQEVYLGTATAAGLDEVEVNA